MDPIKIALSVASTAASAASAVAQGNAQARAFEWNAQVNDRNAQAADAAGEQLYHTEKVKIEKFRDEFEKLNASTSQGFRYNGWMADGDTPLLVALANASEADEEIQTMDYNARVGQAELEEEGVQQRMEADLKRMYADNARKAGMFKAGQSLLSGGSDMYMISNYAMG